MTKKKIPPTPNQKPIDDMHCSIIEGLPIRFKCWSEKQCLIIGQRYKHCS